LFKIKQTMNSILTKEDIEKLNNLEYIFTCNKCNIPKPNKEYNRANGGRKVRLFNSICRECGKLQGKISYQKTKLTKIKKIHFCDTCNKITEKPKAKYCNFCLNERKKNYILDNEKVKITRINYYNNHKDDPVFKNKIKENYLKNKDLSRNISYKLKYGITLEQYNNLLKEQNECCKICNKHEKQVSRNRLYVDHNHNTKEIRGLLCHNCNVAIGLLKEDCDIMIKMIEYLKIYDKKDENKNI
jgi:hypothetical protein